MKKFLLTILLCLFCSTAHSAVTVTSGKIDITSGTETLASIYTAVAASAFPGLMTETTVNKEYIITNAELEISNGATVNITAASYEDGYLHWALTANRAPGLDLQAGGTLTCTAPGFTFNMDTSNGNYNYWYIYGDLTLTGTQAKPIVMTRYYATRFFPYNGTTGSTVSLDYVNFTDPSSYSTSNYPVWFDGSGNYNFPKAGEWSFTNITIDNRTNSGYILHVKNGDWSQVTMDNWTSSQTLYGFRTEGGTFKISDSTFANIHYYSLLYSSSYSPPYYYSPLGAEFTKDLFQPKITFENVTFQDNNDSSGTEYGARLHYAGVIVKYKNCTFAGVDDAMSYGIDAYTNPRILLEGGQAGQTFTNVTNNVQYGTYRVYYDVYSLDLTVQDSGGSPIEDATVTVRQKEGHEHHMFRTDSNGNIKDLYGDLPVFVHRVNYTNSSTFDNWSDGTGNQVHVIEIVKDGYAADTREVNFTANKSITATLNATDTTNKTYIYDSTIYDSSIY